jgi:hypothetical protein
MRDVLFSVFLIALAATMPASGASAEAWSYLSSGTCLASPEGFNSKLEPVNSGVAWTTTFQSSGSADANGAIAEIGQSVDTASFGVGPRMHTAAAHAYRSSFSFTIKTSGENSRASLRAESSQGSFIAGPNTGVAFTVSGFELTRVQGDNIFAVYSSAGSPIIQTLALANGIKYQRVCILTVSIRH